MRVKMLVLTQSCALEAPRETKVFYFDESITEEELDDKFSDYLVQKRKEYKDKYGVGGLREASCRIDTGLIKGDKFKIKQDLLDAVNKYDISKVEFNLDSRILELKNVYLTKGIMEVREYYPEDSVIKDTVGVYYPLSIVEEVVSDENN